MYEPSEAMFKKVLDLHPMHRYMRQYAENNKSVGNMAFKMLSLEEKSWQSLRRYFEGIQRFSKYVDCGEDADKALQFLKKSENPVDVLQGFVVHLKEEKNLSAVSIKSLFYGVKKWLLTNQVSIEWEQVSRPKVSSRIDDRLPTRDELRRIFRGASLRDTALFLTCLSSGLRIGTAISLQKKDVKPVSISFKKKNAEGKEEDAKFDGAVISVKGGEGRKLGKGKSYCTFLTKEAWTALKDYLDSRPEAQPEDPLFAASNKEKSFYSYSNNVTRQWRKLCRRAGLTKKVENHNWTELHTHVLRKFFQTKCKTAGISSSYYDFWLGHTGLGKEQSSEEYLDEAYFRPKLEENVAEYSKAVKDLTVLEDISTNEEVQAVKNELALLRQYVQHNEEFLKTKAERDEKTGNIRRVDDNDVAELVHTVKAQEAEVETLKAKVAKLEREKNEKKKARAQ